MAPLPRSPRERLEYFRNRVNKLFEFLFESEHTSPETSGGELSPIVDLFQSDADLFIDIEVPGFSREDLELYITDDVLIIEGNRTAAEEQEGGRFLIMERQRGRFQRVIKIPTSVNSSKLDAKLEAGVLRVKLPRVPEKRGTTRRIDIL